MALACAAWRSQTSSRSIPTQGADMKRIFEKSVVTAHALEAGHFLQFADLAFKKPGDGIPVASYTELLGRQVRHALAPDHKIAWEDLK